MQSPLAVEQQNSSASTRPLQAVAVQISSCHQHLVAVVAAWPSARHENNILSISGSSHLVLCTYASATAASVKNRNVLLCSWHIKDAYHSRMISPYGVQQILHGPVGIVWHQTSKHTGSQTSVPAGRHAATQIPTLLSLTSTSSAESHSAAVGATNALLHNQATDAQSKCQHQHWSRVPQHQPPNPQQQKQAHMCFTHEAGACQPGTQMGQV
jgi:hypothetical protein